METHEPDDRWEDSHEGGEVVEWEELGIEEVKEGIRNEMSQLLQAYLEQKTRLDSIAEKQREGYIVKALIDKNGEAHLVAFAKQPMGFQLPNKDA